LCLNAVFECRIQMSYSNVVLKCRIRMLHLKEGFC
jgi:hypothetical protein